MRRLILHIALWFGLVLAVQYWVGIIMLALYPSDASEPLDEMWNWNLVRLEAALYTILGAARALGLLRMIFPQTFKLGPASTSKVDSSP